MKNKLIATIILILVIFGLFLLPKNNKEDNELVFWTLQLGTFDKYINNIISEFEAQNPDVKIKWVDVPYAEGEKRTLAALLSDNPPDLINLTPDFSAMAAQKNTLYIIPDSAMNNYPKSLYKSISYNGKFFAIPFYLTSAITLANVDLMKQANIQTIPKDYDTMYRFAPDARKIGCYIEMPTLNENDTFLKILNKYNIDIFKDLTTQPSINRFQLYKTLFQDDLIPKESLTQSHREALEKYMAGQIVFLQAGANFLNIVKENSPDVYSKTLPSQQLTGSTGKYDFSLMNLIIPKKSKKADDALKFALFLTNKKNQIELAKLTSVLPANEEALNDNYFKQSDTKEALARKISAQQIQNLGAGFQNHRNKKNIITALNTSLAEIITGKSQINSEIPQLEKKVQNFKE